MMITANINANRHFFKNDIPSLLPFEDFVEDFEAAFFLVADFAAQAQSSWLSLFFEFFLAAIFTDYKKLNTSLKVT